MADNKSAITVYGGFANLFKPPSLGEGQGRACNMAHIGR